MVDRAPQRLPAQRGVDAVELRQEACALIVVTARVGEAKIEICRLVKIAVAAQVADHAHVVLGGSLEQWVLGVSGIAPEKLSGRLQKNSLRRRQDALEGNAGIVN